MKINNDKDTWIQLKWDILAVASLWKEISFDIITHRKPVEQFLI